VRCPLGAWRSNRFDSPIGPDRQPRGPRSLYQPQLTQLVQQALERPESLYENQKFDGYRIHARLDHSLRLLTRPASTGRNRRGRGVARRRPSVSRRRAMRGPARRHHLLQHDPGGFRQRQRRRAGVSSCSIFCTLTKACGLSLQGIVSKRAALLRNQQRAADCG